MNYLISLCEGRKHELFASSLSKEGSILIRRLPSPLRPPIGAPLPPLPPRPRLGAPTGLD
jgi:hypothetical protein